MERPPISKKESSRLSFDEVADALEGVITTITECKRDIAQTETNIAESQKEYEDLVAMYDPNDSEDKAELEKMKVQHEQFLSTMRSGITRIEEVIADLERTHGEELKMFEELKAAKRAEDFGTSGTAH